jgi:excinuclease ABC subunit A
MDRMKRPIRLEGVRQNNLKNITVEFPSKKLTVITGLSGSGKSSLAFDTLYAEGQRRYVESLSTYTRQFLEKMPKPDLDSVQNIPPAIALEQRNHIINSRSTVGTQTEIVDYLRLFFAKIGKTHCIQCGNTVQKIDSGIILNWAKAWLPTKKALLVAPLSTTPPVPKKGSKSASKKRTPAKTPPARAHLFQVLTEQGFKRILARTSSGSQVIELDEPSLIPEAAELFVVVDRLKASAATIEDSDTRARLLDSIDQSLAIGGGRCGFFDLDSQEWKAFDSRYACIACGTEHRVPEPNLFAFNSPIGACAHCSGFGYTLELSESLIVPDP